NVTFYVMSQCPYGTQVEDAIEPVLEKLGSNVNFRLEFIGNDDGAGNFQSLHGAAEVAGDKIHLCVQKYYPDELIKFVVCQNKNVQDLTGTIDSCAKEAGIDAEKIKTCYQGTEGSSLLSESFKNSQLAGASGSPTIYINGKLYQSARDSTSFQRTICQSLDSHPECGDLPACSSDTDCTGQTGKVGICNNPGEKDAKCTYQDDAKVTLTVVNAKACTNCDSSQLVSVFRQMFLNMEVKQVDAADTEGKKLVSTYSLEKAPAYIFTGNLTSTYAWKVNSRLAGAFRQSGNAYVVLDEASGSTYVLDAKKRAELEKLIGVTKGDNKPQIDFYVMSYCPYGNMAEEAIEPAYQLLKDKAEFNPHYVIYSNYAGGGPSYCLDEDDKYCSMHGIQELNQDIRELCVNKYMGIDKYFKFVLAMNDECTASNADTCWEDVAKDLGLDTSKIKTCEKSEGETLVANELKLNTALGVRGSPTVFVEGESFAGDRSARGYASALCAGFDTAPSECSTSKLSALEGSDSTASAAAAAAGGCG
ncbi:thioredoxin domain-containing protein, partial [Candidatus Woesearchaeota archaeon]|nr:thioredoxin domain-containing protein [Candidatus Woesearchaeota archaeon]